MMTFYAGRDLKLYEERFKVLMKHFIIHDGIEDNKSAAFRHMIDILYDSYKKKEVRDKID